MGYNTDFSGKFNLNKEITFSLSKTFEKLNNGDGIEGQIEDGYCQESGDVGKIIVKDNVVETKKGRIVY